MLWIICSIVSGICLKWTLKRNEDGSINIKDSTIGNILITIIFILIAGIQFSIAIVVYPTLSGDLAEIKALEKRIEDVRNSNYEYKKDGDFIAGSIENYQQSTNLSKYVSELAVKEASYSNTLRRAKVYKDTFTLYFFCSGWAISSKINKLEIID